jgi:hypothetical protein
MANSYTQIHIQYVFVVKFRDGLIHPKWKEELFKYISGIIKFHNHKLPHGRIKTIFQHKRAIV